MHLPYDWLLLNDPESDVTVQVFHWHATDTQGFQFGGQYQHMLYMSYMAL